ncbi:MAG TPA: HYR domain-containing protein [Chryseosolibacter sp.]
MTRLSFKFHDSRLIQILPVTVTVTDGSGTIFNGTLSDGETFEVTANVEGDPFVGNQITISILLGATENIITSCASPIFVGDMFGEFEVIAGSSQGNLAICCAQEDMETTPPVLNNCPSNITTSLSTLSCTKTVTWTPPTASDNCAIETLTSSHTSGAAFPVGQTTVTYTATDRYGNTATCSFVVQVNDITAPTISSCPTNITVSADATPGVCGTNVTWTPPTVSDNCAVSMTSNKSPGDFFSVGTTTVTYTAIDAGGNQSVCSFNVVVNDVTNPVISGCPSTVTVNADAAIGTCGATVTWTPPTVVDNCAVTMTSNRTPGQFFAVGTTSVTYTATDASGRTATCTFNVVVNDVSNPIITGCPSTITVNADAAAGSCGANVTWTPPTVADNCVVNMTGTKTPGQFFPVGTTPVTYTATDASGRTATCTFNVVVNDVTNPVISGCPATVTVNALTTAGSCGATVTWTPPTVSDNCVVNMTSNKTPGQFFPVGTTAVVYTATDASGRTSTCTFNVVVNDITKPVVSGCPANIVTNTSTCDKIVSWTPPTVTDNCSATLTSNFSPGATFPVGVTVVTYTATDPTGNIQTCSFNVTVMDNIRPVMANCTHGAVIEVTADNSCHAVATWALPTATDNCSVVVTGTHSSGDTFPLGQTDVTYTATDPSGNVATCKFKVLVKDRTNPVISSCPSNITTTASTSCGAIVSWTPPAATDNCSAVVTSDHAPGEEFPIGTTVVTYTATDAAGNLAQCSFNVVVTDTSAPTVTGCPANITSQLSGTSCAAIVTWTPPAFADNCAVTVSSTKSPGDAFPLGTTTVTYTGTDPAGNVKSCSFNVIVNDVSLPVISGCPTDVTVVADASCNATATWIEPTFTDNCTATMVSSHSPGQTFSLGQTIVTYTATDAAGNKATCSFKVIVTDNSVPVIQNCSADISVVMDVGACSKAVSWTAPIATDNCTVTLTSNISPGHMFTEGTTEVVYTAMDGSGNTSTCSFNVTVSDVTAPTVASCPANIEVTASANCLTNVSWTPPAFTDNCGTVTVTSTHSPDTSFPPGITSVTYTGTDASGNSTSCAFNVIVVDRTAPVLANCPASITASTSDGCTASVTWVPPSVTDNCQVTISSTHQPGASFSIGTTRVTYTATDAAGNQASCSFDVIVTDGTRPVFTSCPGDVRVLSSVSSCSSTATWTAPTIVDCSTYQVMSTHQSGATFSVGSTTVTYVATDLYGNTATCSFLVIVEDKTAPVFTNCPADILLDARSTCDAVASWTAPVPNDNCGILSLTSSHQPGGVFPVGVTPVVYTAADVHGNIAKCQFNVIVKNTSAPVISGCPADVVLKVIDTEFSTVSWVEPLATVVCGNVSMTSTHSPGDEFSVGETLVKYTAIDDAGNTSICSFIVRIEYEKLEFSASKLITPDGDGINDGWLIENIEKFKENRVTVFDRWGGVVYATSGYDNQTTLWKGFNNAGASVPTGTYFYTITVRYRGDYVETKGFIELVR